MDFQAAEEITIDTTCIGFIGLGIMGYPTVKHLLEKNYKVVVYDIKEEKVASLVALGAQSASSIQELASQCTLVFTIVTGPKDVLSIYLGPSGLIANMSKKNCFLIESSTIGYPTVKIIREEAEKAQQIFLDCPISGGSPAANNGTLTFMVGGNPNEFAAVENFLGSIGKKVIYAGLSGHAQIIKICNNMCFAMNMMAAVEGYKMLSSLGADPQKFTDIANESTGGSFVTKVYSPQPNVTPNSPSNDSYKGGYSLNLALKDMHIGKQLAVEKGVNTPLLDKAIELYEQVQQKGLGHMDFGIVFKNLE